jgi:hypothetical protein
VRTCAALVVLAVSGCNSLLGITDPVAGTPPVDGAPDADMPDDDAGANEKPTVSITAPLDNATVKDTVTVSAIASDPDGSVVSVKFEMPDGSSVTDATSPFSTTWNSSSVPDGPNHRFKATATDNKGATAGATATVTVRNIVCIDETFNAAGLPLSIPDNTATGINSNLAVAGNGKVGTLSLSLQITHPFKGDLVVTLVAPGGGTVLVANREGGAADNIIIVDRAITMFDGMPAAGTWQLQVQDLASGDLGTLDSWSLKIVGDCT